jgi:hypothetical protein
VGVGRVAGAAAPGGGAPAAAVLAALTVALQEWSLSDDKTPMSSRLRAALAVVDGEAL